MADLGATAVQRLQRAQSCEARKIADLRSVQAQLLQLKHACKRLAATSWAPAPGSATL
jgi:hypothetical protein